MLRHFPDAFHRFRRRARQPGHFLRPPGHLLHLTKNFADGIIDPMERINSGGYFFAKYFRISMETATTMIKPLMIN